MNRRSWCAALAILASAVAGHAVLRARSMELETEALDRALRAARGTRSDLRVTLTPRSAEVTAETGDESPIVAVERSRRDRGSIGAADGVESEVPSTREARSMPAVAPRESPSSPASSSSSPAPVPAVVHSQSDAPEIIAVELDRSPRLLAWVGGSSRVELLFGFAGGIEVWLGEGESYRGFSVVHADGGSVVAVDRATRRSQRWLLASDPASPGGLR